jgi:diguanylate cyclase (GGDEF)-like protein/PAS domain S-box-containing protein
VSQRAFGTPGSGLSGFDTATIQRLCLGNLLEGEPARFYFKDLASRFVLVSRSHLDLFGAAGMDDIRGRTDFDFFTVGHAQASFDVEQEIIRTGVPVVDLEECETWPDRPDSWVVSSKQALRDDTGAIIGTFGISRDITVSKLLAKELEARTAELHRVEGELRSLLEGSPDVIARYDLQMRYLYANPAALRLLGREESRVLGCCNGEIGDPLGLVPVLEPALLRAIQSGEPSEVEFSVAGPSGVYLQARIVPERTEGSNDTTSVFFVGRDLTTRKRAEDALAAQAVQDPLTGLANRVLLLDRLEHALLSLGRRAGHVAVLFLDLDQFKSINDRLGHSAGDAMLIHVAQRLQHASRKSDTVARFGGDEFVVLFEQLGPGEDEDVILARVQDSFAEPFRYDGRLIPVRASVGVAMTGDARTEPRCLISLADDAMYEDKQRRRSRETAASG